MDFLTSTDLSLNSVISTVLHWQVVGISGLTVWVLAIIVMRRTWGAHRKIRSAELQEFLVEQALASIDGKPLTAPRLKSFEHGLYQELLVSTIMTLQGKEHSALVGHYIACGYLQSDEKALKSVRWWIRLAAAIRLSQLESPDAASALMNATNDRHHLIPQIAVDALSRINQKHTAAFVLETVRTRPPERDDLLQDLLFRSGNLLGSETILMVLAQEGDVRIKTCGARALGQMRSIESVPTLIGFCTTSFDASLIEASLHALKLIGDPRAESVANRHLHHGSPKVRVAAIELAAFLGSSALTSNISKLQTDPSVDVRRAVQSVTLGRSA